jgi:hypothetical protein
VAEAPANSLLIITTPYYPLGNRVFGLRTILSARVYDSDTSDDILEVKFLDFELLCPLDTTSKHKQPLNSTARISCNFCVTKERVNFLMKKYSKVHYENSVFVKPLADSIRQQIIKEICRQGGKAIAQNILS